MWPFGDAISKRVVFWKDATTLNKASEVEGEFALF